MTPPASPSALPGEVRCLDCGCDYTATMACDMLIPKEQWLRIHPEDGGVLCANCMLGRAEKLPGAINITGRITFADEYNEGKPTPYDLATAEALDLDAIEARANAATPGPWEMGADEDGHMVYDMDCGAVAQACSDEEGQDAIDAIFIAHARTDVPTLVTALRSAHAKLRALTEPQRSGPVVEYGPSPERE